MSNYSLGTPYSMPPAYNFVAGGGVLGTQKHIIGQPNSPYFHLPDDPSDNTLYYDSFPGDYPRNNFALHLAGPLFTKQDEYIETPGGILHNGSGVLPFSRHYGPNYGRVRYGSVVYEWPDFYFNRGGPVIDSGDIYDNDRFDSLYVQSREKGWPFNKPWKDYTGTTLGEFFHYLEAINNLSYYPPGLPGAVPTSPLAEAFQPQLPLGNNGTPFPPNRYPPAFNTEPLKSPFLNPYNPVPLSPSFHTLASPTAGAPNMSVSSPRPPAFPNYPALSGGGADMNADLNRQTATMMNAVMSMGASALNDADPMKTFQSINRSGINPNQSPNQRPVSFDSIPAGQVQLNLNDVFAQNAAPNTGISPLSTKQNGFNGGVQPGITPLTGTGTPSLTPGFTNNPISGAGNPFLTSLPTLPGNDIQNMLLQYLGGNPLLNLGNSFTRPALPGYFNNPPSLSPNSYTPAPSLWGNSLSPGLYPYTPGVPPYYNQFTPPVPGLPGNFFNNPYSGYFPPTVVPANVPTIPTFYPYLPLDASPDWRDYTHRHVYGNESRQNIPPRDIFLGTHGVT